MNDVRVLRFADLFAGLGGTRLGVEQACRDYGVDSRCVFSSDKKAAAVRAYAENFGVSPSGDITKIDDSDIGNIDMLTAGFPCQPFSIAGARRGFADTRGTLFFEVERILVEKRPKIVLLENVEGLVKHDSGNTLRVIVSHLENLGYMVSWRVLDASEFGVPQKRKRIFICGIIGVDNTLDFDRVVESAKAMKKKTIGDILEKGKGAASINYAYTTRLLEHYKPDELYGKAITDKRSGRNVIHSWDFDAYGSTNDNQKKILAFLLKNYRKRKYADELGVAWRDGMPLNIKQIERDSGLHDIKNDLDALVSMGYLIKRHPYKDGSLEERTDLPVGYKLITARTKFLFNRILDPNGCSVTLTATDANKLGVVDGESIRRLTKREMLRMFGFPESYTLDSVTDREATDLCGNSICVPVVSAIVKVALEQLHF